MIGKLFGEILKYVIQGAIGVIKAWWAQEKRVQAEWLAKSKAGQLKSFKSTLKFEAKLKDAMIATATANTLPSPAAWNREARGGGRASLVLLALMIVLCAPACLVRTVYIDSRMPILPKPDRPMISVEDWTEREEKIIFYTVGLETVIIEYNAEAARRNKANGYE